MNRKEFDIIKKRILAQVNSSGRDYVANDLMMLWNKIKKKEDKKEEEPEEPEEPEPFRII